MISNDSRSSRFLLVLSLAFFAVAGIANASFGSIRSVGAVVLAVAGVYGLARYAQLVGRKRLALCSLALWVAFLAVTGAHLAGLEPAGGALALAMDGLTWATLLGAGGATTFLGFREYDAGGVETPDDTSLDGDLDL